MMYLLGYSLFILVGFFFGFFGSGGSILIIPVLIYIFNLSIYEATTYSLLLVFLISLFGTLRHVNKKNLHIQHVLVFIIPALLFTSISRVFLFPEIPEYIVIFNSTKQSFLMTLFAVVIFVSAIMLLRPKPQLSTYNFNFILPLIGSVIGLLTGLLGIGGGFVILPALILFTNMKMKAAAASTLFIIMLNTFLALMLEITVFNFNFNFQFIASLLLAGIIGTVIGINMLNKIDQDIIKKVFSITLLLLSLTIFLLELI